MIIKPAREKQVEQAENGCQLEKADNIKKFSDLGSNFIFDVVVCSMQLEFGLINRLIDVIDMVLDLIETHSVFNCLFRLCFKKRKRISYDWWQL